MFKYARTAHDGYDVSSRGDKRFSALYARLSDGRTIEEAYQLDVKGYRTLSDDWRVGKGKPPLNPTIDAYAEYKALWERWASENPGLMLELAQRAAGKTLTDVFATSAVSQARALAEILNEGYSMANWLTTIDLRDIWTGPEEGRMSLDDLANMIADRLEAHRLPKDCTEEEVERFAAQRTCIIESFRSGMEVWQFDESMRALYDWADQPVGPAVFNGKKLCWVDTI